MDTQLITIEEIQSNLKQLRKNTKTQRRFPQKLWDSIIQLAKIYPLNDICHQLAIHPAYLKRKIQQSKENELEFRELTFSTPLSSTHVVTIQLSSNTGLNATIQGPISCLDCLHKLFGR
jgi:hypothetical protein